MRPLTRKTADALADRVLAAAVEADLLPAGEPVDWDRYARLRELIHARFHVPATTITPLMARVLYGVGCLLRPARLLGIGTYVGHAFAWLSAPGFGPERLYNGNVALAVDVDADAITMSQANLDPSAGWSVEHAVVDGREAPPMFGGGWDALWLDADDPDERKGILAPLLDVAYPFLAPGSVVLTHDIAVDRFGDQMRRYRERISDPARFAATGGFVVDPCGVEISVKFAGAGACELDRART